MSGDMQRVIEEQSIDNTRGGTQRVIQENSINNLRGVTQRVIVVGGGGGGNIDELNVTPSTTAQTITASGGTDGYSPVNVAAVDASIDANITAGNIKKDVSILGVTGTYEGSTPTGTMYIISNGTYNVADKAIANVQVPTTAPALYREFQLDGTGKLVPNTTTTHLMDFTGMTDVSDYVLASAYRNNTAISGVVDMSDLTALSGSYACNNMFNFCTGLTSVDMSSLTTISGGYACSNMFANCTGLTSVDLSSLTTISGGQACNSMFQNCTGITSADLSSLTIASGTYACGNMFQGCTSLTTVRIGNTTEIDFGTRTNQFSNMFFGCPQNIDVYAPAASQSAIEAFSGYPNFGGTGTVTWHWNS